MWRLLSTCVGSSHSICALSKGWYEALQKKEPKKVSGWWTPREGICVWLSLRGQSGIQNSSYLLWEWEEEKSKPGTLPPSAKGRTSSCWNCERGRVRGGCMGILLQNQNFNLSLSLDPFLMTGSITESRFSPAFVNFVPVLSASDSETTQDAAPFSKVPIKSTGEMQSCECNRVNQDFQPKHVLEKVWWLLSCADPCNLIVQVKQILETCRLFPGMYFYEGHSSQTAGNL